MKFPERLKVMKRNKKKQSDDLSQAVQRIRLNELNEES
jgi:hypothetical protein